MADSKQALEQKWLAGLASAEAGARLAAAQEVLSAAGVAPVAVVAKLEQLALHDRSKVVRQAAVAALGAPAVRQARAVQPGLSRQLREWLVKQFAQWEGENLLRPEQTAVLSRRFDFDSGSTAAQAVAKPASPRPESQPKPKRSLGEVLMSESTIKTALYLGAFFIVMAAFIFSALLPMLRIPILGGVAVLFLAGSVGLKRSLGQASFVLFTLYSLLVPLVAGAIFDALPFLLPFAELFWIATNLFLLMNWIAATWLYHARFFSILAALAWFLLPLQIGGWLELRGLMVLNLCVLANLALLALLVWWQRKSGPPSWRPVWWLLQGWQVLLLLSAFFVATLDLGARESLWLLAAASLWLLATGFYLLSGGLFKDRMQVWLGALAGLPVPLYLAGAFEATLPGCVWALSLWALLYLTIAELSSLRREAFLSSLADALGVVGELTALVGLVISFYGDPVAVIGPQAFLGLGLGLFMLRRPRHLTWIGTLAAAFGVYRTLAYDNLAVDMQSGSGLLLLPLLAVYWILDVGLARLRPLESVWSLWPRLFGAGLALLCGVFFGADLAQAPGWAMAGFSVLAVLLLGYFIASRFPWGVLFVALAIALAWGGLLAELQAVHWVFPSLLLPIGFGLAWLALASLARPPEWARSSLVAALGLAIGLALVAHLESGATSGLLGAGGALVLVYLADWLAGHKPVEYSLPAALRKAIFSGVVGWATVVMLAGGGSEPFGGMAVALLLLAMFMHLAMRLGWVDGLLPATAYGAGALYYLLAAFTVEQKLLPLMALAALYLAAGLWPKLDLTLKWGTRLRAAGLVLAAVLAFIGLGLQGWQVVFGLALAAVLYTVEAFRRRSVLMAIPADALYLAAYFKLLLVFDITQPQFYSVGAAVLGLLMHYLLARSENGALAFIAGMISQLALLLTTYFQMIDTGELIFFFILFFQALLVVGYGLVLRSRSLVFTPIAILVLAVLTVVFTSLSGLLALGMIGCTGFALLFLGILALVLRERLAEAGKLVRERFGDWSA